MTISERTFLQIDGGVIFASVTLLPRLLRDEWFFAPQLALWFVGLLAQYYLLFPAAVPADAEGRRRRVPCSSRSPITVGGERLGGARVRARWS